MQKAFYNNLSRLVEGKAAAATWMLLEANVVACITHEKQFDEKSRIIRTCSDLFPIESSANFASFNIHKWPFGARS